MLKFVLTGFTILRLAKTVYQVYTTRNPIHIVHYFIR